MPAMTLHALGLAVGKLNEHTAQLVLHNPVMHAEAKLNRAALTQLAERMLQLAETLTDPPAELALPETVGRLLGPDGTAL